MPLPGTFAFNRLLWIFEFGLAQSVYLLFFYFIFHLCLLFFNFFLAFDVLLVSIFCNFLLFFLFLLVWIYRFSPSLSILFRLIPVFLSLSLSRWFSPTFLPLQIISILLTIFSLFSSFLHPYFSVSLYPPHLCFYLPLNALHCYCNNLRIWHAIRNDSHFTAHR